MLQDTVLENLEIVIDRDGEKKRAILPWPVWEKLLAFLQHAETTHAEPPADDAAWASGFSGARGEDRIELSAEEVEAIEDRGLLNAMYAVADETPLSREEALAWLDNQQ